MSAEFLSLAAYVKIFVAMIVIVNPLGIMPVFVAMTASQTDGQRKTIARLFRIQNLSTSTAKVDELTALV